MSISLIPRIRSSVGGYALAVVLVASALGTVLLLGRILPFTFFLAAVMLAAWFHGAPVGVFALVLSLVVVNALLGRPPYVLGVSTEYVARFATFACSGMLVIWMSAARRRAERALQRERGELDLRVRERTASLEQAYRELQAEIHERRRGERRLAVAQRRARERVLQARFAAQLEERTRLAREIHDTLLQGFTGVSLQLLAAMGRQEDPVERQSSLEHVLVLAQKTLADARQAVWDMRPPALEGDDFGSALRSSLERALADTGIELDYVVRGVPRPLDPHVETVLFRVAQEAVTNVVKHSSARSVRVVLSCNPGRVRLAVVDDGTGFVVDSDLRTYAGHWGLLGMRERASQLHGRLAVRSTPGTGTKVVLRIPDPSSVEVQDPA